MCGIAGFIKLGSVAVQDEENLILRMNRVLRHRGPDDSGSWISPDRRVAFGHARLSILDLSPNGHQPMMGRAESVLVYNGELYNFQDLRRRFPVASWRSTSDTEVLLRCYETDGVKCLEYLNGMFAFALWDSHSSELFLARDRVGIKPLYYTTLGGVFAFASEIKALLILPWVSAQLDEEALSEFLSFNHVRPPATMFKDISKFHPGYRMVVNASGIRTYEAFWKPNWGSEIEGTDEELQSKLLVELEDSVRRQMVSDVRVGAFLSGGVDSSGLVALASRVTSEPLTTYSIGFEGAPDYTEFEYARQVARKFKTNHVERVVQKEELEEFLPKLADIYDEPLADATSIPLYFISELARANETKVVLSGDGADELFGGYRSWASHVKLLPYYRKYLKCPSWIRQGARALYSHIDNSSKRYELLRQAACSHEVFWGAGGFRHEPKHGVLSSSYANRLHGGDGYQLVQEALANFRTAFPSEKMRTDINWLCYDGFTDAVPNYYCYRADHIGMARSIEVRVPYLDNKIVDLAFSLPSRLKLKHGEPKYILKAALEAHLPNEILYRRKMGFCVPIREWAGATFTRYIDDHLKAFCRETGLFDEQRLREQICTSSSGNSDYAFGHWNLYFLMAWMRKWIL
jgi:asparagine synthase (glutamine-hydrolysing)